jgi:hypothetical protein
MHTILFPLAIMLSVLLTGGFIGLAGWLVAASVVELIEPIWWGGKALFNVYLGATILAVSSVLTLIFGATIFARGRRVKILCIFAVGVLQGFLSHPILWLVALIRQQFPYFLAYENYASIVMATVLSAILCSALTGTAMLRLCRDDQGIG